MARLPVQIKFTLIDQVTKNMEGIGRAFRKTSKDLDGLSKKANQATSRLEIMRKKLGTIGAAGAVVGASMTAALTVPIAAAAKNVIQNGAEFEEAFYRVKSATNATGKELTDLNKIIRDTALGSRFTASQVSAGAEALGKAGYNAKATGNALQGVMGLSLIENMSVEDSADFLSSTLTVFNKGADEANHFADVLVKASGESQISLRDLQNSMKYSGLAASELGMNVEQTAAFIAGLGQLGVRGEMAGTTIRNITTSLFGRSRSIAALKEAGVTEADLFARNSKGELDPNKVLPFDQLMKNLSKFNLSKLQINKIFGTEFGPTMSKVIPQYQMFINMTEKMNNAQGALAQRMEDRNKGLNAAIDRLSSAWQEFSIRLTEGGALDGIAKVIDGVSKMLIAFTELPKPVQQAALMFAGFLAILGPIIAMLSAAAIGFSMLSAAAAAVGMTITGLLGVTALVIAKITLLTGLVIAAGAAIYDLVSNFKEFGAFLVDIFVKPQRAWEKFLNWAESRLGWLRQLLSYVIPGLDKSFNSSQLADIGRMEWDFGKDKLSKQPITPFANPEEWLKEFNKNNETKVTVDFKNVPKGTTVTTQTAAGTTVPLKTGKTKNVNNSSNYKTTVGGKS